MITEKVKVYAKTVEDTAAAQIREMSECEAYKDCTVRIMPDCHAGAGCTIGTVIALGGRIVPNTVGVDIGCGMQVVKIDKSFVFDMQKVDRIWHEDIPSGMNHRSSKHRFADQAKIEDILAKYSASRLTELTEAQHAEIVRSLQ